MRAIGLEIEVAPRSLATVDLHGKTVNSLIPPIPTGNTFSAYCSNEWKAYVVERHLDRPHGIVARFGLALRIDESRPD